MPHEVRRRDLVVCVLLILREGRVLGRLVQTLGQVGQLIGLARRERLGIGENLPNGLRQLLHLLLLRGPPHLCELEKIILLLKSWYIFLVQTTDPYVKQNKANRY
jgi:hypothetical protein